jgi:hypothetical protein
MPIYEDAEKNRETVETLLEMTDEQGELLERLMDATEHIRDAGGSSEEKGAKIEALLAERPDLRDALRQLTGSERWFKD